MTTKAKRILLAEDEVALRDFVSRNLRVRGFEVLEASNGLEALAVWEREDPHLLIVDIMMPRMDGFEVCRRVREHSAVPIIVLTALDEAVWGGRTPGSRARRVAPYPGVDDAAHKWHKTIWRS